MIVLATTVIAAKNIPGLLEMAVLQHLPFDAGAATPWPRCRRYLITVVGLLLCFGILGVGWSKVQWLVAAMGLGLGFGLQEIFANFISGLIILFERPVRVGDVVTIDDITGVVSRIRMRATTITDGDRKELIIPNKEFITGRVLNWTLTDPVNRVVIRVGIAYGSDTQRAARDSLETRPRPPQRARRPAAGGVVGVVWRQRAEFRAAMLPAELGQPRHGDPRAAHGHRPGVPRGGHRNALSRNKTSTCARSTCRRPLCSGVGRGRTAVAPAAGSKRTGKGTERAA